MPQAPPPKQESAGFTRAIGRLWHRSSRYKAAVIAVVLAVLILPTLFLWLPTLILIGPQPTPTPSAFPSPASTSMGLSGKIEQVRMVETGGGGLQLFIELSITNHGPATIVQNYSLLLTHATSKSIDYNSPPEELRTPYSLPREEQAEPIVIKPQDDIQANTSQALAQGGIARGWLRFILPPLPPLSREYLKQPGIQYDISFADATGATYSTTY